MQKLWNGQQFRPPLNAESRECRKNPTPFHHLSYRTVETPTSFRIIERMSKTENNPNRCACEQKTTAQRPQGRLVRAISTTFASLKHRNYRLFFFGQLVSLVGTWMQWTAQGWLVYQITGSKLMLGVVGMVGTLPLLLFSNFGGVLADRFPKRTLLLITQSSAMIPPFILAILVLTGTVEVWHIATLAGILGLVIAFDIPARQSFIIEMVGRKDLMNAIGLNSGIFNSARIVGPAVAGIVMAAVGIGYCFLLNSLSYIPVVVALALIRVEKTTTPKTASSFWKRMLEGFAYVKSDPRIVGLLALLASVVIFGFSYMVLLPAFAKDIFAIGETGYAKMLTFKGIGALVGALTVASLASRIKKKQSLLFCGVLLFSSAVATFTLMKDFNAALLTLLFAGAGMIIFFSTANSIIQTLVPDEFRGRVMGIWTFVFGGSLPVGRFIAGTAAEYIGLSLTVQIGVAICATATFIAILISRRHQHRLQ